MRKKAVKTGKLKYGRKVECFDPLSYKNQLPFIVQLGVQIPIKYFTHVTEC